MIRVVTTGKSPTMRDLARTHRVSVARLHEVCKMKDIRMVYEETSRMCADIFTKAFANAVNWKHACVLIHTVNPAVLFTLAISLDLRHDVPERRSPESRGYPTTTMTLS